MSQIYISKKIKSMLGKVALCTTLCLGSGILTGCSSDSKKVEKEEYVESKDSVENKDRFVYDFHFAQKFEEDTMQYESVNWEETENLLKQRYNNFVQISRYGYDRMAPCHNYEIAMFEDFSEFGEVYFKIVDKNGYLADTNDYGSIRCINDYITLLSDFNKNVYTILNHNTGTINQIYDADYMYYANGYIAKLKNQNLASYDRDYELLYADGTVASDTIYRNIVVDYSGNKLYLQKDTGVEILDTETGKARIIDGEVTDASNNFLVLHTKEGDGVYYLSDIESDLIEKIPCSFKKIKFAVTDETEPVFSCDQNFGNKTLKALFSVNGERLSKYYEAIDPNEIGYVTAINHENNTKSISVLNRYGVEELSNINAESLFVLGDTNFVEYRQNNKFGIMDFNGTILTEPIYDRLNIWCIVDNDNEIEKFYFIGRINDENITIALDENLNEICRGDYRYYEMEDKVDEKESQQKRLSLN